MNYGTCHLCGSRDVPRIQGHYGDGTVRLVCADCIDENTREHGAPIVWVAIGAVVLIAFLASVWIAQNAHLSGVAK